MQNKVSYRKWMLNAWCLSWTTLFSVGFNLPFFFNIDRTYYIQENYPLILTFGVSCLIATVGVFIVDTLVWVVRKGEVEHLLSPNAVEPI